MRNDNNIGQGMAEKEIEHLLKGAQKRLDEPPHTSHCPDHDFQQKVNYAMLLALYVLLRQPKQAMLAAIPISSLTAGIVAGLIIGFTKLLGL